jgi:hypothetical protein
MKNFVKKISLGLVLSTMLIATCKVSAEDSKVSFSVGSDIVSSYVWRGVPQDAAFPKGSPNIQPFAACTIGGLTIGAWGSGSFTGTVKEFDLYATYAFSGLFSMTLTDYNWNFSQSYFKYGEGTDHVFEGTLSYAGIESFPLSATLNTMFYGADKLSDGKQAYSTYLELAYPLSSAAKVFAGASLGESSNYGTDGFGITNVGIKVSKSIEITDKFSLPVYGIAGFNPSSENAFLVAGITL